MDLFVYRLLWVSNLRPAHYIMRLSASCNYCHSCLQKKKKLETHVMCSCCWVYCHEMIHAADKFK